MRLEAAASQRPLPLIHLNGFPGTGKLTIARALQGLLRSRLVHNHMLINAADAVLQRTEPGYQELRRALRGAVLSSLAQNAATHAVAYVFTDFQTADAVGSAACAEYLAAARSRRCVLVSVRLHCDEAANLARLRTPGREALGKIVDAELLAVFRRGAPLHRFDGPETTTLDLDVSALGALEAARCILEHVLKLCPEAADAVAGAKALD